MSAVRSSVASGRLVLPALITMLKTSTGKMVGDHDPPSGAAPADGYYIVYGVPGGGFTGPPLWSPESDAVLVYQITSVGHTTDHVQWLADRARLTLLSRVANGGFQVAFPVLAGVAVTNREPDGPTPEIIPGGPPASRTYNIPERFRFYVEAT